MATIHTDDPDHTTTLYHLAIPAHTLDRRSDFHLDNLLKLKPMINLQLSDCFQIGFSQQSFILMRHHVRLDLRHEIHYDHHDDEQ